MSGDHARMGQVERDIEQAITALKKGAYLLKYGRRGKPKFCPFRLANDESVLVWFSGKEEKHLKLSHVSRIIPGQRTLASIDIGCGGILEENAPLGDGLRDIREASHFSGERSKGTSPQGDVHDLVDPLRDVLDDDST